MVYCRSLFTSFECGLVIHILLVTMCVLASFFVCATAALHIWSCYSAQDPCSQVDRIYKETVVVWRGGRRVQMLCAVVQELTNRCEIVTNTIRNELRCG